MKKEKSLPNLSYISYYPEHLKAQVRHLIHEGNLGKYLLAKYPSTHTITTDKALYQYAMTFKTSHFKKCESITKVLYDGKISDINDALGLHRVSIKNHGGRLRSKNEIRVSSIFKTAPEDFLKMIVVHELAHLKVKEHNKAFYALCENIVPTYHQIEFDVRLYLIHLELLGKLY